MEEAVDHLLDDAGLDLVVEGDNGEVGGGARDVEGDVEVAAPVGEDGGAGEYVAEGAMEGGGGEGRGGEFEGEGVRGAGDEDEAVGREDSGCALVVGGREAAGECDAVILLMSSLLRRPLLVERRKNDLFE